MGRDSQNQAHTAEQLTALLSGAGEPNLQGKAKSQMGSCIRG